MNGQRHLRLVEPPPPQVRRRYETRIVVSSTRMPIGRSRNFHLSDSDLERLISHAERLEGESMIGAPPLIRLSFAKRCGFAKSAAPATNPDSRSPRPFLAKKR